MWTLKKVIYGVWNRSKLKIFKFTSQKSHSTSFSQDDFSEVWYISIHTKKSIKRLLIWTRWCRIVFPCISPLRTTLYPGNGTKHNEITLKDGKKVTGTREESTAAAEHLVSLPNRRRPRKPSISQIPNWQQKARHSSPNRIPSDKSREAWYY